MTQVYLLEKFSKSRKNVTLYYAESNCKTLWTENKMKAKIFTDEIEVINVSKKFSNDCHIAYIPII